MKNTVRAVFGVLTGFIVIFIGSIEIPGYVLPLIYGPYPEFGDPPFIRTFTDFWLSAAFTVLGGYLAALVAGVRPLLVALIASGLYFALSLSLYLNYELIGTESMRPYFMLLKVPVGGWIGGWLYKRYNKSLNMDAGSSSVS